MKKLVVLWDPENPLVPAAPLVEALSGDPELRVRGVTFRDVGHQTLPNGAFSLAFADPEDRPDGILWIEGGPLPGNLNQFACPKVCWLVNTALEPTLLDDLAGRFDRVYTASLRDTADERTSWLPAAGESAGRVPIPAGVSVLLVDPEPPEHARVEAVLASLSGKLPAPPIPVVIALGNGRQPHPVLVDCLRSGAAVLVDTETDLRGIAHVGEHLEVIPSQEELPRFLEAFLGDSDRLGRLSGRGPAIATHLHEPGLRAGRIREGLWPRTRVLSGEDIRPRVSVLVTCFRYLRRLRVCLESLARQNLPGGSLEIVVADPSSPDGLPLALEEFAVHYPGIRVVHCPIEPRYHRNRGLGINRAFEASLAPVVIAIDGDLVFPPDLIGLLEEHVLRDSRCVYGIRRSFVGREDTEMILGGKLDPFAEFEQLSRSRGDGEEKSFVGVLGYCQAVHRSAFARARYPEEFDLVNQSDIVFVERLAREAGVSPRFLEEYTALHLWHPRNWMGTTESL